jgi:hypothetical protein
VSPHLPATVPPQARLKPTLSGAGSPTLLVEHNQIARRVVDYLHQRILKDPRKHQTYSHEEVGAVLGIEPQKVRASLAHAGTELITVVVSTEDRAAIKKVREKQCMLTG